MKLSHYQLAAIFLAALCCHHPTALQLANASSEPNDKEDANNDDTSTTTAPPKSYSWDYLLRESISQENPIIANGNVFPPPPNDDPNNCLLLLTNSQIMRHCPENDSPQNGGSTDIVYHRDSSHIRGIFVLPEYQQEKNRVWFLSTPGRLGHDYIEELDTISGEIKQVLRVPGTKDAHDAVLFGNSLFVCDTRSGDVVELALPSPKTEGDGGFKFYSNHYLNKTMAKDNSSSKFAAATVIQNHKGFTRTDHINNVAVHKDVLLLSLHGADGLKPKIKNGPTVVDGKLKERVNKEEQSKTRLSALSRHDVEKFGRELNVQQDEFDPVDNMGTWCHGIAFWEETSDNPGEESKTKLIGLDSKAGSLVSVVVSGPGAEEREREVLWKPDKTHPVLQPPPPPPNTDKKKYRPYKGMIAFSKGLAVQGDIAYFGVSAARKFREHINPTLLVAVNLKTKEELWVRSIQSRGVINQVVTESYLGYQLKIGKDLEVEQQDEKDEEMKGEEQEKEIEMEEMKENVRVVAGSIKSSDEL